LQVLDQRVEGGAVDRVAFVRALHRAAGVGAGAVQRLAELLDQQGLDALDRRVFEVRRGARIGEHVVIHVVDDPGQSFLLAELLVERVVGARVDARERREHERRKRGVANLHDQNPACSEAYTPR
jgi:hypothetical protein